MAAELDEGAPRPGKPGVTQHREIVVVGASAGGVEALVTLTAGLPRELRAAVFVVLHVLPGGRSVLSHILGRESRMPVAGAVDGEAIELGRIYVAQPDRHMLLEPGRISLSNGEREKGHRPAVDPLFRSAADAYGPRVIGAVLSGALDDGAAGLRAIGLHGGATLVQDPGEARYASMPRSALASEPSARTVRIAEMADAICGLIDEPLPGAPAGEAGMAAG